MPSIRASREFGLPAFVEINERRMVSRAARVARGVMLSGSNREEARIEAVYVISS